MLKNINENNQDDARRLLHCLAVSIRPLRVEELAEILTFDFDAAEGSIPKFHPDRRPRNPEHTILSICSSLIAIVGNRGSRVVQFSHLSVKEFLTSSHLASSTGYLSSYRILPGPAHTILAQACLGLLIQSNNRGHNNSDGVSPLAKYAAQHWVTHTQFEDVASRVIDGMELLFDADKAHFAAWIDLYDIDAESGGQVPSTNPIILFCTLWILSPSSAHCHQAPAGCERYWWLVRVSNSCGTVQKSYPSGGAPSRGWWESRCT